MGRKNSSESGHAKTQSGQRNEHDQKSKGQLNIHMYTGKNNHLNPN